MIRIHNHVFYLIFRILIEFGFDQKYMMKRILNIHLIEPEVQGVLL